MKGDFTRNTFRPEKHYSGVRMQQGRVQLDADWNEQQDILTHHDRATRQDVIGHSGGPLGQDGFRIREGEGVEKFIISPGRYYVAGILCENDVEVPLDAQPHPPDKPENINAIIDKGGTLLAYLDVWERHVTALEEPDIREQALGGPDTATRTEVVWQVKLQPVEEDANCGAFGPGWAPADVSASTGRLKARAQPGSETDDLCGTPASGGYRGLENQLYRVEIHSPGQAGQATFKWSRENGSVVAALEELEGNGRLTLRNEARDGNLGFAAGQWVEVTDNDRELRGEPGTLVQLVSVEEGRVLTIAQDSNSDLDGINIDTAKVRRWDMPNGAEMVTVPAENEGWLGLEGGVEIQFMAGGHYQTGDHWQIPARSATRESARGGVLWPVKNGNPVFQERMGVEHHYSPLALIRVPQERGLVKLEEGKYVGDLAEFLGVDPANGQERLFFRLQSDLLQPDGSPLTVEIIVQILTEQAEKLGLKLTGFNIENDSEFSFLFPGNLDLEELNQIRFKVGQLQITDCRSLYPVLGQPAIHILDVTLANGKQLRNDTDVLKTDLEQGLRIICDRRIDPVSVRGRAAFLSEDFPSVLDNPTCFVTLEVPLLFEFGSEGSIADPIQMAKLTAEVHADRNIITWTPTRSELPRLQQVLSSQGLIDAGVNLSGQIRLLARLTVKGKHVWTAGIPRLYLDGETFTFREENSENIDLRLPSGNGRPGSDFEMWFWLVVELEAF